MSANTETTGGPPKGYGECVSKCGRWAYMCGGGPIHCNACVPSSATYMAMRPDWTPPIAAPAAPKIEVKATVDGKCPLCGVAVPSTHIHGKHQATCEKCSDQEAPKAAPALEWSFTDKEGRDHWFAAGVERDAASRAYWSWMAEQTGKPYAGPERLPRPQLAADWAWDCLPESDR